MRLAAVQHLRTVYGIKIKNWNKNKATSCKLTASHLVSLKTFNQHYHICLVLAVAVDFSHLIKQLW